MKYLLMGHGALDVDPSALADPDMYRVGVAVGTTLQFYADVGQRLEYAMGTQDVRTVWNAAKAQTPWAPIDYQGVAANLRLSSAFGQWSQEFIDTKTFMDPETGDEYTLIRPGIEITQDPIQLCTGTPDTCPTRPEQTAQGETHTCDGILGLFAGEMHWLACTGFASVGPEVADVVAAVTAGRQESVRLGGLHPDWTLLPIRVVG
ncbi:hypothetical protein AB0N09_43885 [Streptomyces erythrochromogenes]|uniref:putative adhesin n=1 Tax=Streptomyces erythrochromogenes TaxID=285574 RepID=UPI003429882B